jgi:hypothetical protein
MNVNGMTVLSAQYANEDKTEVCLFTKEKGAVILSNSDKDAWGKLLSSKVNIEDMPVFRPSDKEIAIQKLDQSDKDMARVAEDVIGVLIAKGVISEADLPASVSEKLANRKTLRKEIK